ncbi:hypothetical protein M9458_057147, partial [Cirrhinus mrigala]
LHHSSLPCSFKHPTIIPREHHITKLIIAHCHERVNHQGKGFTMNEIRANGYWIPKLSQTVASYIRQCVFCRKQRRPVEGQKMRDLPTERIEHSPPFTYCGMDVFGPFLTKQARKEYKRQIKCDQGTNFVGAKNELSAAQSKIDTDKLTTFLAETQCDFVLNTPHASHAGGVWERQIRTVRNVLNATLALAPGRLTDSSLRTFLYEAAAIVNSRPLTTDNLNDPNSLEPLTPNHLVTLKPSTPLPPSGQFVKEDLYARKRWRQ